MGLFSDKEVEVLSTIIIALESGGAVYGNGDWGCFGEAYTTTSIEHAITIGAGQWYGVEALRLLKKIYQTNPAKFKALDNAGIYEDFNADWTCYNIKKTSAKAKAIIAIISSDVGKKCQKLLLGEQMQEYAKAANALGVTETDALAECCNFHHQGGYGAMKRVIAKTQKPYTLDNLYRAVLTDNVPNQVGTYTSRQNNFYNMMKRYWPKKSSETTTVSTVKERATTTANKPTSTTTTTATTSKTLSKTAKWTGYATTTITPRVWAGYGSSAMKTIKQIALNEAVKVCDTIKAEDGKNWYYVYIQNKSYGFVPATNISTAKVATQKTQTTTTNNGGLSKTVKFVGTVTADSLYVRKWAGTENAPLTSCPTVTEGTKVDICDSIKASDGSTWYYIKTPKGTFGFSSAKYISKS